MSNMKYMRRFNSAAGFTLVEMLVVAPLLILILGAIVISIVTLTGESLTEGGRSQLIIDVHDALDRIESDARASGSYLSTNNFTVSSPQGADDAAQKFVSVSGSGDDTLILNSFFTTTNPASADRGLIYLPNTPFACNDASIAQNQVMTMNVVYFVKDSALWRRVVATSNYASKPCPGVTAWQQPNCAATTMSTNPSLCKAQDEKLLTGVTPGNFTVTYYVSPSDTVAAADTENPDPDLRQIAIDKASTIQVTLKGTQTIAGRDISQQGLIRITRSGSVVKYATPNP
jgi:type II secretory pathway pseudopilin PulG